MRILTWLALVVGAIIAFFAWANWQTRRNRLRTTKEQFEKALVEFLAGDLEIDDWELFLAHPMGRPELEALRLRLRGFTWEAGEGRDEVRDGLAKLRSLAS